MDPKLHSFRVEWSREDREYVALCPEFPGLSWLAKTRPEALSGMQKLVAEVDLDLAKESHGT